MNICILGSAGAGKSTVTALIAREVHAQVIDLDEITRTAYAPGTDVWSRVVARFSRSVVADDGSIDQEVLSNLAADPSERAFLDSVAGPAIQDHIQARIVSAASNGYHTVLDSYALSETRFSHDMFHHAVVVVAPPESAVIHLRLAHGWNGQRARALVDGQPSATKIIDEATTLFGRRVTVVENNGDLDQLHVRLRALLSSLLAVTRNDEGQRLWAEFLENESSHMLSIFIAEEQRASWLLTASAALLAVIVAGRPTIAIVPISLFFLALVTLCFSVIAALAAMYPVDGYKRFYSDLFGAKYRLMRDLPLRDFLLKQAKPGSWSTSDYLLRVQFHYRSHWLIAFRRKRMMAWATLLTLLGVVLAAAYVLTNLI